MHRRTGSKSSAASLSAVTSNNNSPRHPRTSPTTIVDIEVSPQPKAGTTSSSSTSSRLGSRLLSVTTSTKYDDLPAGYPSPSKEFPHPHYTPGSSSSADHASETTPRARPSTAPIASTSTCRTDDGDIGSSSDSSGLGSASAAHDLSFRTPPPPYLSPVDGAEEDDDQIGLGLMLGQREFEAFGKRKEMLLQSNVPAPGEKRTAYVAAAADRSHSNATIALLNAMRRVFLGACAEADSRRNRPHIRSLSRPNNVPTPRNRVRRYTRPISVRCLTLAFLFCIAVAVAFFVISNPGSASLRPLLDNLPTVSVSFEMPNHAAAIVAEGSSSGSLHIPVKAGGQWKNKRPGLSAKAKAAAAKAKESLSKEKDHKGWNYLPIENGVPRRYRYGANFQEIGKLEADNGLVAATAKWAEEHAKAVEIDRKTYRDEADYWRRYAWERPGVDPSLAAWDDFLDEKETALRAWLKEIRMQRGRGRPIGLAAAAAEQPDRATSKRAVSPLRLNTETSDDDGPGDYFGGSMIKWIDILQNEASPVVEVDGVVVSSATCSRDWMLQYRSLHEDMMAQRREPKLITYMCEKAMNCGGLGDRLLGITSALWFSLVTGRAFHAEWQAPIPLDTVLDSGGIDWAYSTYTSDTSPIFGNKTLVNSAQNLDIIHFDRRAIDATFGSKSWNGSIGDPISKGMAVRDLAFNSPWVKLYSNRGWIYRSFSYPHLQSRIDELGVKPLSAFSCILEYLFRLKAPALDFVTDYTSLFSLPTVFSVGIQIRTGDLSMRDPEYDLTNTVQQHSTFFKCADQLVETYALPDQKIVYFLVTDSQHLREDAIRELGDKVIISGLGIEHIHQRSGHADGVHNAVAENWILAKTDYRVTTQDSGFGKLAAFASAKRASTVTIFPQHNPDVMGMRNKQSHINVDCRLESAFSTFDELSNEWSLG